MGRRAKRAGSGRRESCQPSGEGLPVCSRRTLLRAAAAASLAGALLPRRAAAARGEKMAFGLVTYQWGRDWDLPTLIRNCERAQVLGVELRTEHAHGVEPGLSKEARAEVAKRFADGPVTLVGIGSNQAFDSPDPEKLKASLEQSKRFVELCHDCGGSGLKVKPNDFHPNVPREKTIEQIGRSLNELAAFAAGYGQQIRLEVHGKCAELPTIKAIMDVAQHENVRVCWNCNSQDLEGQGLEHNFRLVRERFGDTAHIRELNDGSYPYAQLFDLLVATDYDGWVLLEARTEPADRVAALAEQRALFQEMVSRAQKKAG